MRLLQGWTRPTTLTALIATALAVLASGSLLVFSVVARRATPELATRVAGIAPEAPPARSDQPITLPEPAPVATGDTSQQPDQPGGAPPSPQAVPIPVEPVVVDAPEIQPGAPTDPALGLAAVAESVVRSTALTLAPAPAPGPVTAVADVGMAGHVLTLTADEAGLFGTALDGSESAFDLSKANHGKFSAWTGEDYAKGKSRDDKAVKAVKARSKAERKAAKSHGSGAAPAERTSPGGDSGEARTARNSSGDQGSAGKRTSSSSSSSSHGGGPPPHSNSGGKGSSSAGHGPPGHGNSEGGGPPPHSNGHGKGHGKKK